MFWASMLVQQVHVLCMYVKNFNEEAQEVVSHEWPCMDAGFNVFLVCVQLWKLCMLVLLVLYDIMVSKRRVSSCEVLILCKI